MDLIICLLFSVRRILRYITGSRATVWSCICTLILTLMLFSSAAQVTAAPPAVSTYPSYEWQLTTVGARTAWQAGATGLGAKILVIDSGLDKGMAATLMSGSILPSFVPRPFYAVVTVPCTAATYNPDYPAACQTSKPVGGVQPYADASGHGSAVACEIVCHASGYYRGIAPQAKVAVAKIFTADTGSADPRNVAASIYWGVRQRVSIISLSVGALVDVSVETAAVAAAVAHGVVIVAAAGNDGMPQIASPADLPGVVSVGASDYFNQWAPFSNYGEGLSLAAPGNYVYCVLPNVHNTIGAVGLVTLSGTSMAAPLVSGALADLESWGLSGKEAVRALLGGAYLPTRRDKVYFGAGILSLPGAMAWSRRQGLHL